MNPAKLAYRKVDISRCRGEITEKGLVTKGSGDGEGADELVYHRPHT